MLDSILFMETARASTQAVSLNAKEKQEGRSALKSFLSLHPAEERTFSFARLRGFLSMHLVSSMVLVLLFGVGGGAVYAAEDTVPGDLLYPLKVEITEPLRVHLHWNPERRAQWAARRIERRMREGEELIRRGHRPPKSLEELQVRMGQHLASMEERLSSVESEEKAERIRMRLEEMMTKHEELLSQVENGDLTQEDFLNFRREMRQKRERVRGMRGKHRMEFRRMHPKKGRE